MIYPSVITLNLLLEVITNETISNIVINTNPHAVHINPLAHLRNIPIIFSRFYCWIIKDFSCFYPMACV